MTGPEITPGNPRASYARGSGGRDGSRLLHATSFSNIEFSPWRDRGQISSP